MAIQSFGDHNTEYFFIHGKVPRGAGWAGVKKVAIRKLDMVDFADKLADLRPPPGNRLVSLKGKGKGKGKWKGYHSIRINNQWRIVFCWTFHGPEDVRTVDYH